ncbi:PadR family transcriptional regulator [Methanosarcina sp. Mfa9]|uniref:PadR family transcriptional regulator n=1 Tax=Methanosarcina sp. Mfa9 TaxID=3439063 RepID=UPI003F83F313
MFVKDTVAEMPTYDGSESDPTSNRPEKISDFRLFEEFGSNDEIETIIKKHLNIVVLSLIKKKPMCGQDIIKEIFTQFNVFISQSSVYPILYSLKDKDVIEIHSPKGDLRTKIYVPTEKGEAIINAKINEFALALDYVLSTIK